MRFRRRNRSEGKDPEFMIIPMIDIIFFLLVFFMISTLYMVQQNLLPVQLPQASTSQSESKKNVNVTVTEKGMIRVEQEEIPLELLRERLKAEVKRDPESTFVLRGDRKASYETVVIVLDEMKASGIKRIAIATELKKR